MYTSKIACYTKMFDIFYDHYLPQFYAKGKVRWKTVLTTGLRGAAAIE
jgi:hypothetical protein